MYQLSKEECDRIKIVKFMAIILIVYLHSYTTEIRFSDGKEALYLPIWLQLFQDGLSQVISRCGVPIFFLISSILFFRSDRSYGNMIGKKARTLLLPYLIWNTFWIVVFIILQGLPFTEPYFSGSNTPILQCSLKEWFGLYGLGQTYPFCYPLWFVRDLMVIFLFCPIIKAAVDRCPHIMSGCGVVLIIFPLHFYGREALAWFIIGAVIVKKQIHITCLDRLRMSKVLLLYLFTILISLVFPISVLRNISILAGIIFWFRISKEIYMREKFRAEFLRLSKWTFIIFVFHELTLSSIKKVCLRLFPTIPGFLLAEYMLIPIFVVALCMIVGSIFKKILPGLYDLTTGMR